MAKVVAVVVTYNRKDLLREGLNALLRSERSIDEIVVIDNLSNDGTDEMLASEFAGRITHVRMKENVGGAGGFYEGTKRAFEKGADWIWLMDDDTAPEPDALGQMLEYSQSSNEKIGFLCSHVVWTDGRAHHMNVPVVRYPVYNDRINEGILAVENATFVSVMFSREAVATVGYPIKELFIYGDDTEYCTRVSRLFPCYYITKSVAVHMTKSNLGPDLQLVDDSQLWKYFYANRNSVFHAKQVGPRRVLGHFLVDLPKTLSKALSRKSGRSKAVRICLKGAWIGIFFRPKAEKP